MVQKIEIERFSLTSTKTFDEVLATIIAGAGHFCWEEKPAEYAALPPAGGTEPTRRRKA